MSVVFWAWVVVAVVCALSECVSGGFYSVPWALGAATAALLEALHLPMTWQWIAFLGGSTVVSIVIQRFIRRRRT